MDDSINVIFLDIDGVLNTTGDKELIENTFELNKLNNLIKLVKSTDSYIIIISDRRIYESERIMINKVFGNYHVKVDYLSYERTHKNRSDEIIYFINNNDISNYVILDDNDLGYSNSILINHFINTYQNGFDMNKYNEALNILENGEII